jgi:hypothetical protein
MTEHLRTVGLDLVVARDEMITSAGVDGFAGLTPSHSPRG